jgi:hypothetical protein
MRKSNHTILIICEGKNTEPLFFNSIRNEVIKKTFKLDATITIWPEPLIEDDQNTDQSENNPHKKKRIKLEVRPASIGTEPEEIKGIPPEKWVRAGLQELETGAFKEVWTVFDHDNHPNRKEAFELAEQEVNGKKVQIAFSSRSFEYYLLLHFERIFKTFTETECKEILKEEGKKDKKVTINCGTKQNPNDCNGEKCINGYARLKNYWTESKEKISFFPVVKEKLEFGFENAAWVRFRSEQFENHLPIYNRNPYTSADFLIKRLIGLDNLKWIWISDNYNLNGVFVEITDSLTIRIENRRKISVIIHSDSLVRTNVKSRETISIGRRTIIEPNKSELFKFPSLPDSEHFLDSFKMDDFIIILDYSRFTNNIPDFIEKLFKLTHRELINLIKIIKNDLN